MGGWRVAWYIGASGIAMQQQEQTLDTVGRGPGAQACHVGGAVLNAAVACARLGQPTAYLTQVSSDLFGAQILAYLQANGVDIRHVLVDEAPSTLAFVERTPTTNRYAFYRTGAADTRWAPAALPTLPESCRFLHFGSISLLHEPAASRITDLMAAHHGRQVTLFDPNLRPSLLDGAAGLARYRARCERWLALTDLLKLSDEDAALLAPGVSLDEAAAGWLAQGPAAVVLTRGAEGATLYRPGHAPMAVTAPSVTVADTIGAGDTFAAGLSVALLERGVAHAAQLRTLGDADWAAVLRFAATAAALNCTREGCDPPSRDAVRAALAGLADPPTAGAR